MEAKMKKCKSCKEPMEVLNSLQRVCSMNCAIKFVREKERKEYNAETIRLKVKIRTKSEWLELAQKEFNRFIRARDYFEPCISCGTTKTNIQYAAGHYLTVGGFPELRFDENNCHKQCNKKCNGALSGNIAAYRINLVKKIGAKEVESLEGPHKAKCYIINDIKIIKSMYSKMAKKQELENELDARYTA